MGPLDRLVDLERESEVIGGNDEAFHEVLRFAVEGTGTPPLAHDPGLCRCKAHPPSGTHHTGEGPNTRQALRPPKANEFDMA